MTRRRAPKARVIDLGEARVRRSLAASEAKIALLAEASRSAVSRLHDTGALFTPAGTKAGRDLLLVHQHLLRILTLLRRLGPEHRSRRRSEARVYEELDALLQSASELTARTGTYLTRLPRD